jgi:hypothetical protein
MHWDAVVGEDRLKGRIADEVVLVPGVAVVGIECLL